jgi:predicted Zn-dependent protease with MMP-like domain/Flp pilus assembly protein TadD
LLDRAANAFEEGRFDEVVSLADRALQLDARSAPARHFRAAGLVESGRGDEGLEEYERALKLAPDDPEILLGMADLLICRPGEDRALVERGLALCQKGRKLSRKSGEADLEYEFLLLEGTARNQLGECAEAIEVLDEALAVVPDSIEAALERAIAMFELCRFDEAHRALKKLTQEAPEEPWAHHYLGLIAERRRDAREAKKHFARAQALAPEEFPPPVRLDDDEFDRAVEDAVAQLPVHVKQYLENATIAVEPIPSDEDLTSSDPPLSPSILGVFRGTPVGERSVTNAFDHFPASIVLYQRNLERFARNREELIEQIGITLMHEVGHLIGLDEHDLWERGLE